jgi:hypothetical protein
VDHGGYFFNGTPPRGDQAAGMGDILC